MLAADDVQFSASIPSLMSLVVLALGCVDY